MEGSSANIDICEDLLIDANYIQGMELAESHNGGYVLSVVDISSGFRQPFHTLDNMQYMSQNPSNFINLEIKRSPGNDIFNPDGTLRIVGYDTPAHPTSGFKITTPIKPRGNPRFLSTATPDPGISGAKEDRGFAMEDEQELLESPLYARIFKDKGKQSTRRRSSKIPQALPLQKVSKRRTSEDQATCFVEEPDGEVVVLMNGVLTKVGKPSVPASSGKYTALHKIVP